MKKLLLLTGLIIFSFCLVKDVQAGADDNVWDWAWSENIGWVSFNCVNQGSCAVVNYGVNIDDSTGNFSGYAWSENTGWIDFAPVGPYPASPNYSARVDTDTGEVSGWVRNLSYDGGWEGWIKLRGTNYGVSIDMGTGDFSGWAWSDMVIGWISFSGTNYGVITSFSFNQPPDKATTTSETWDHCVFQELSLPTFHWIYSDPDGDPQTAYEVRIDNDSDFSVIDGDEYLCGGEVCSGGDSIAYTPIPADWSDWMDWNRAYWWIVRVQDSYSNWSPWSDANQFVTPLHPHPSPDFTHEPPIPTAEEEVTFVDSSVCYSAGPVPYFCKDNPVTRYQWDFEDDLVIDCDSNINSACRGNATTSYPESGNYLVRLYVTDDLGTCDTTGDTPISTSLPFPEYKEVPPIIWMKKALASVYIFFQTLFGL